MPNTNPFMAGINTSSGIGQGEAQVFNPFVPNNPYSAKDYIALLENKRAIDAEKQKDQNDYLEKVYKGFEFDANEMLPEYQRMIQEFANKYIDESLEYFRNGGSPTPQQRIEIQRKITKLAQLGATAKMQSKDFITKRKESDSLPKGKMAEGVEDLNSVFETNRWKGGTEEDAIRFLGGDQEKASKYTTYDAVNYADRLAENADALKKTAKEVQGPYNVVSTGQYGAKTELAIDKKVANPETVEALAQTMAMYAGDGVNPPSGVPRGEFIMVRNQFKPSYDALLAQGKLDPVKHYTTNEQGESVPSFSAYVLDQHRANLPKEFDFTRDKISTAGVTPRSSNVTNLTVKTGDQNEPPVFNPALERFPQIGQNKGLTYQNYLGVKATNGELTVQGSNGLVVHNKGGGKIDLSGTYDFIPTNYVMKYFNSEGKVVTNLKDATSMKPYAYGSINGVVKTVDGNQVIDSQQTEGNVAKKGISASIPLSAIGQYYNTRDAKGNLKGTYTAEAEQSLVRSISSQIEDYGYKGLQKMADGSYKLIK